ncbi:MAG: carboxy-S-adenosyl-L-methionine synthase CmoA [Gammaproteobacteria bacterium]
MSENKPSKPRIQPLNQEGKKSGVTAVDQLFDTPQETSDFQFSAETASVFDDMVNRSVPFYAEMQRMTCELAADFAVPGTNIYDIGCATGTTLLALDKTVSSAVHLIGLDNSDDMLNKARMKIEQGHAAHSIELVNVDLNDSPHIENCSVVIMLLTLQFVRPLYRERMIKSVLEGLHQDGCLILIEKVTGSSSLLNRLFIDYYYNYKRRRGYSDLEISQKREALENVLIPYHHEENQKLLKDAGFRHVEEFFRWYNFAGLIAVK